jgi:hypothetical protein
MFVPKEGGFLNVQLPQELIRATVHKVVDDDQVIVHLNLGTPMSKTHAYKMGDLVPAQRRKGALGDEVWEAVPEYMMTAAREEQAAKQRQEFDKRQAELAAEKQERAEAERAEAAKPPKRRKRG